MNTNTLANMYTDNLGFSVAWYKCSALPSIIQNSSSALPSITQNSIKITHLEDHDLLLITSSGPAAESQGKY